MLAIRFYDVVVWLHISAVLVAFGGVFTYPFWFRVIGARPPAERVGFHRAQALIGQWLISPAMLVILLAGAYLASDAGLWGEVWVLVPLAILLALGALGGAYFGPKETRLGELAADGGGAEYDAAFRQMRTVTYVALALVLVAAFFMVVKPGA
jgi:hypothetical protein